MKSILHWILYSNLLIALGAVAFTARGFFLLDAANAYDSEVPIFAGFATLCVYLLIRFAAVERIKAYPRNSRWAFFFNNIDFLRSVMYISGIIVVIVYLQLPTQVQLVLFIPGIISVLYGLPLRYGKKKTRLRDIGIIKIFLITFVWAFIGSVLPATVVGSTPADPHIMQRAGILFLADACFILAITLPFDIKDMDIDQQNQVRTIPVIIGREMTINLALLLLFIAGVIYTLFYRVWFVSDIDLTIPMCTSVVISGMTIYLSNRTKDDYVYFGLLDGMIILQWLLVMISYMLQGAVAP